ncbi:DUF1489 family protein [Methylocella sp. CPCC 101449]|uniref:DUF1489 family protein n=1 Tax=Methylocella sp. CPCC 101449 TaxID=2987531 RepID=UPI00288EB017|nr:DUF1489 family protein [Methylocella sp. CPCC 101449]MDT2022705.1 DUF1489 family protein [Methylocella sp. CPCC 101449]
MALHLIKLSVGAESIRDHEEWVQQRMAAKKKAGEPQEHTHRTRMVPKRVAELLDGGSMYWVIKGQVSARQKLIDVRPFTDDQGISRCFIVMEPDVIPIMPRPCRPFQGWRYLKDNEKPEDVTAGFGELAQMPEELRRELRELGLL